MADDDGDELGKLARSPNHEKAFLNLLFLPEMVQVKK